MKPLEIEASPSKHVDFQRGNSRVVPNHLSSPRSALFRRRPIFTPQKYLAAQQQSRKTSNPIAKARLDELAAPNLEPPKESELAVPPGSGASSVGTGARASTTATATATTSTGAGDEDEWQDVDHPADHKQTRKTNGSGSPRQKKSFPRASPSKPSTTSRPPPPQEQPSVTDTSAATTDYDDSTSNANTTTSFFGFTPSAAKSSFARNLEKQTEKFSRNKWTSGWTNHQEPVTPEDKPTFQFAPHQSRNSASRAHKFWLDPSTPGLIALYLQVCFNLAMVSALLYAIFMFYVTIRNDVDMKVEEYSVDIVDQIAKCSFEYLRNGCEPSKRVPAIEAACQQWERCMQRDPKEVGRAKVSAETFGHIIEAFLKPIGIKSMVFLIGVFAGSFLLINAVFASRIGPRFSHSAAYQAHAELSAGPPPPPPSTAQHYPPQVAYAPPPTPYMYSPSPRLASNRHRQPSVHASFQSSPRHPGAYFPY